MGANEPRGLRFHTPWFGDLDRKNGEQETEGERKGEKKKREEGARRAFQAVFSNPGPVTLLARPGGKGEEEEEEKRGFLINLFSLVPSSHRPCLPVHAVKVKGGKGGERERGSDHSIFVLYPFSTHSEVRGKQGEEKGKRSCVSTLS